MLPNVDWNPLISLQNQIVSNNHNAREPAGRAPTHIIIHITGTDNFKSVRRTFTAPDSVSAHYLVHADGSLYQFVVDARRAYHAGIDKNTRALYRKPGKEWQKYLKYFEWYKSYPADAVYLDGDLRPVWDKTEAAFVSRADRQPWEHYNYFNKRWSSDKPLHFENDPNPNNYSIGIETLGVGSPKPDSKIYTSAMYGSLKKLIKDLCGRYQISNKPGYVVGHEDVNPIGRFGWDPGGGFEWEEIHEP